MAAIKYRDPYVGTQYDVSHIRDNPYLSDVARDIAIRNARTDGFEWTPGAHVIRFTDNIRTTAEYQFEDFMNHMYFRKNFKVISVNYVPGYGSDSIVVAYSHEGEWTEPPAGWPED